MKKQKYNTNIFQPGNKFLFHDTEYTVKLTTDRSVKMTNDSWGSISGLLILLNSGDKEHKLLSTKKRYNNKLNKVIF